MGNPFAGERTARQLLPGFAEMTARWGPPLFWRGRRLQHLGAREDARAIEAWAEFQRKRDDADDWAVDDDDG